MRSERQLSEMYQSHPGKSHFDLRFFAGLFQYAQSAANHDLTTRYSEAFRRWDCRIGDDWVCLSRKTGRLLRCSDAATPTHGGLMLFWAATASTVSLWFTFGTIELPF